MALIPTKQEIEKKRELKRSISSWLTEQMNDLTINYDDSCRSDGLPDWANLSNFSYFKQIVRQHVLICLDAINQGLDSLEIDIRNEFDLRQDKDRKEPLFQFYIKGGNAYKYTVEDKGAMGTSDWDTQLLINPWLPVPLTETVYERVENLISATFEQTAEDIGMAFAPLQFTSQLEPLKSLADYINAILDNLNGNVPDWRTNYHPIELVPGKITKQFSHINTGLWESQNENLKGENLPSIVESDRIPPFKIYRLGWLWKAQYTGVNASGSSDTPEVIKSILMELIDVTIPRKFTIEAVTQWHEFIDLKGQSDKPKGEVKLEQISFQPSSGGTTYIKTLRNTINTAIDAVIADSEKTPPVTTTTKKMEEIRVLAKKTYSALTVIFGAYNSYQPVLALSKSSDTDFVNACKNAKASLSIIQASSVKTEIILPFPNVFYHAHEQLIMLCEVADGSSEHPNKMLKRFMRFDECATELDKQSNGTSQILLNEVNGSTLQIQDSSGTKTKMELIEALLPDILGRSLTSKEKEDVVKWFTAVDSKNYIAETLALMQNVKNRSASLQSLDANTKNASKKLKAELAKTNDVQTIQAFLGHMASYRYIYNKEDGLQSVKMLSSAYSNDQILDFIFSETQIVDTKSVPSNGIRNMFFTRVGNRATLESCTSEFVRYRPFAKPDHKPVNIFHDSFQSNRFTYYSTCVAFTSNGEIRDCITFLTANKAEAPFHQFEDPNLSYKFYADLRLMAQQRKAVAALIMDYVVHTALSKQVRLVYSLIGAS
ncbi:hypothetical protein [Alteromonas sp. a30]|uniref:hypothetical protein n=1 Tax=Alteromonas sp. a30 TaxID=2730917 RepID=UPI0022828293|nr:hypothetical protein [Alteromonas sp. a30]MCY7297275.1 hypothetical protein [Alteromonas sp. a30]